MGQDSHTLERGSWEERGLSHHALTYSADHRGEEVQGGVIVVVLPLCQRCMHPEKGRGPRT